MSYFPAESLLERYDDRVYLAQFGLQLSEKGILSFKAPALQSVREFGLVKIFTTIIMQVIVIYVAVAFLLIYIIRCAFIYGHRTSKMPTGERSLEYRATITCRLMDSRASYASVHRQSTPDTQRIHTHKVSSKHLLIPSDNHRNVDAQPYVFLRFTEWAKQYSGLYTLKLGNETMAVITDRRIVRETIDRKSSLYNHRPSSFVSHDLITKGDHLLVMHYGNHWRTFRRLVHQHLNDAMVENEHLPIIDAEAVQLVRDYMLYPKNHMLHSKRFSNSISNSISKYTASRAIKNPQIFTNSKSCTVFGVRSASSEGEYMNRLYHLMENWSAIMEMGATPPVDIFPWMKYIPERLLGSYISRARSVGWQMSSLYSDVLTRVVTRRERDSSVQLSTFMDRVLDEQEKNVLSPNQLIFIGGVLMEGGSDTTSSLILAIVQAMIHYPSVQRKAQAEIDQVVGAGRSPQCSDLERLPYINMIVKEGHRWRPILPLCFPHALGEGTQASLCDNTIVPFPPMPILLCSYTWY